MDFLEQAARSRPVMTKFAINNDFLFETLHDLPRFCEKMRSMNIPGN